MSNKSVNQEQPTDKLKTLKGLFLWSRLGAGLTFAGFLLSAYNAFGLIFTAQLSGLFLLFIPFGFAWLSYVLFTLSRLVNDYNLDESSDYADQNTQLWLILSQVKLFFQSAMLFVFLWIGLSVVFTILGLLRAIGKI